MLVIDRHDSRLNTARRQNAEAINFNAEGPVEVIRTLPMGMAQRDGRMLKVLRTQKRHRSNDDDRNRE